MHITLISRVIHFPVNTQVRIKDKRSEARQLPRPDQQPQRRIPQDTTDTAVSCSGAKEKHPVELPSWHQPEFRIWFDENYHNSFTITGNDFDNIDASKTSIQSSFNSFFSHWPYLFVLLVNSLNRFFSSVLYIPELQIDINFSY